MRRSWPAEVDAVLEQMESAGYRAYLVGGCVRDMLLARNVSDYDIATNARPEETIALFERTIPTGLKHGTVTVLTRNAPLEVTTFRVESSYSDGRRPDAVLFRDAIEDDLARRDFTINAMALDRRGHLVDPYGGQDDLRRRRIRTVGDPRDRFDEDGLRILRALRFAAQLSFDIDSRTLAAMDQCRARLANVSRERVGQELAKLAESDWWHVLPDTARGLYWRQLPGLVSHLARGFTDLVDKREKAGAWYGRFHDGTDDRNRRIAASLFTWAYLSGLSPKETKEIGNTLAWAKAMSQLAANSVCFAQDDPLLWPVEWWRHRLYDGHLTSVELACQLWDWLEKPAGDHRVETCREFSRTQPITEEQALTITGTDIAALGARDKNIGNIKRQIIDDVLMQRVENERQTLLIRAQTLIGTNQAPSQ